MAENATLPVEPGDVGEPVRDLQARLSALGFTSPAGEHGSYGPETTTAVGNFQETRGLTPDGVCGRQTWSALVEAGYGLGDRLLYHRSPMLRGDDVTELQRQLSTLGFDAGRVDGFFGPNSETALKDFQRNAGVTSDGVCGRDTVAILGRLGDRTSGDAGLARVRETEALLNRSRSLRGARIVIGDAGGLAGLVSALEHHLADRGAIVVTLQHPDQSEQASAANEFGAEAFIWLDLRGDLGLEVAYFAVPGFESIGGRRLAEYVETTVPEAMAASDPSVTGMRLPVLRETRMPAVACRIGPPDTVVEESAAIASALARALERWIAEPLPDQEVLSTRV